MKVTKPLATAVVLATVCLLALRVLSQQSDYDKLKADAEKLFAEGSYAQAHELYSQAAAMELPPNEKRWVTFRVADTLWRAQAATRTADTTKYEKAQRDLEALVRDIQRVEDRDRVWVEVQESLGDFHWARRDSANWGAGWQFYSRALDWWAGAKDIELARERYLKMVWKMTSPAWRDQYYYYGSYGNWVPLELLENVLKIAQTENDKAHAHYLIAMTLRYQGSDWSRLQRVPEEFEAALAAGKSTDWYDDALFNYAQWMESSGIVIPLENGGWRQEQDYVKALELYRRLVKEFQKGETRYYDQAQNQIQNITKPVVGVGVSNIFLPDSEIQYFLSWRNVTKIDLALYKVDLPSDMAFANRDISSHQWLQQIDLSKSPRVKSWTKDTGDKGDHKPGQETLRLDAKLPMGAYVLEARGGGERTRDILLVTDASLILKTSGKQALVYFANALDGSPLASARVRLWEKFYDGNDWRWRDAAADTNKDGIAVFEMTADRHNNELFAAAALQDRQAFAIGHSYRYHHDQPPWRIYAFTDRPAYRPNETVQWKFVARRYSDGVYSTPADQSIEFDIYDPRGAKVKDGKARLNGFGSAWGSLTLTEQMPLGEYRIQFFDEGRRNGIGGATLFRLEEYKLPEFKVTVQTPEVDGKKKSFRLGEKVEVNIQADYYFGGAVANATCEVLVYQNPFYQWWEPRRDYPWFYEDMSPQYRYGRHYGNGQIIKRETLKTDATGKAVLTFDTPANAGQDFEYRVEARVTDASRREIIGSDTARVTRQRYYVYPRAEHCLYRPQDKVTVNFKALDANNQPVQVEGSVKVTRDYWFEIWLDPNGKEIKGDALKAMRAKSAIFPPPPRDPRDRPWQLKFQGYEHDEILTRTVKTNAEGEAEFTFTPEREGYYRIAWTSEDSDSSVAQASRLRSDEKAQARGSRYQQKIQAETTVWVCTNATTELGYRHGGLEIIVDKDTFRAGQRAPVMLVAPTNDRYVLFSVEGDDLYSYQLVRMTGTVKLVELPIEEKHVPNIFLSAAMVSDRQIFMDTKQVVVPPVRNFLTVDVKPDRDQYQPREDGVLNVTTRDADGKPVAAEVALGLVDESVYYIQQDYAGDPRQFYFGTKRPQTIQTQSTFQQKSFAKLVEGEKNLLIDELVRDERLRSDFGRVGGDVGGKDAEANVLGLELASRSEISATGGGFRYGALAQEGDAAMPASAPMDAMKSKSGGVNRMAENERKAVVGFGQVGEQPAVTVRSDFRSTVFWQPDVVTDKDGKATVKVKYPDSLTSWRATARAASSANQFGIATATTRTKQPLIVRLQAPRFFLVGDTVTISAVINNNTDKEMSVETTLVHGSLEPKDGIILEDGAVEGRDVKVAPNGEARIDWAVAVVKSGETKLKVLARAKDSKYSDAMEKTYPVFEHGIEKFVSKSGKARGNDITVKLNLPKERKPESTALTVQIAPSMAVTMLDALPYLADYPYGCTEQTMSRFLPAVITAKTLKDLGLKPEAVANKIFGGIEGKGNATVPVANAGIGVPPVLRKEPKDLRELDAMTKAGLQRLYDFQHADGGWGWWKQGESDHFMTAYVAWGMTLARDAGTSLKGESLERGINYLDKEIVEEETNHDMQAFMLHALSAYHASAKLKNVRKFQQTAFENLWKNKDKLNAYTRSLLALAAHNYGYEDKAKTLIASLENGVKADKTPDVSVVMEGAQKAGENVIGTAHWGEDGIYWRWSDGGVEATAFALRALLAIDPKNKLVEPVTNWLIKNRRGAQWSNTRDTAIVVLALNDYLRVSGELKPDLEYELLVNGKSVAKKKVTAEDALGAPSQFAIDRALIKDGENEIRIRRKGGDAPIYFAANAKFFSLEEPITPAGNEIFVRRQYYKIVGRPTLLKGFVYDKQPLNDRESVTSGDRVEVVVTIEAKNNYEYLVFEDLKPAGLEAVQIRSGESLYAQELKSGAVERKFGGVGELEKRSDGVVEQQKVAARGRLRPTGAPQPRPHSADMQDYTGRNRWVYQELRDRKVALFIDKLPEGVWEIRYDLRAEVPGQFHALPVLGHAMYVPEIRCNGAEVRIKVEDKK
jgi:uncharacterized protein YfaS (alpha-2-macroglobulin family)